MPYARLRLILGDQLNENHSWFREVDNATVYCLFETHSEATYTRHHVQKITGFFLAMRAFANRLRELGHHVVYRSLDETLAAGHHSITDCVSHLRREQENPAFEYQLPDEWRLDQELKLYSEKAGGVACDSEHFLSVREDVGRLFADKQRYLMETFYREMRRRHDILMDANGEPATGQWNYDQDNRGRISAEVSIPESPRFERDGGEIVTLLERHGIATMGRMPGNRFTYPVTRRECLEALSDFCRHRLVHFGTYQDAMTTRHPLLFHANLSFAMNTKLLGPREVIDAAINAWRERPEEITINQVEGFVRQILGWREYMRGVYWAQMPEFAEVNALDHRADLPEWYWTGDTKMNCLSHAINQSLDLAYAHHIQRLMITGNFALILGAHPDAVDAWYLGVYIDAIEWVEITNTRGMSQRADGGLIATKPYCSSANYINKMSDYCRGCHYDPKQHTGPRACPFNSLYWDFLDRHRERLGSNYRMAFMYKGWERKGGEQQAAILERAAWVKAHVNEL
ncbi:deoxyribodipyrimidine photolyase-related protein [Lewinella marina]|uniref:Cryptochrome/photolyase family protein n=1 Tax=Neolewinella marina TaxID=438751 RepID=A0A2G0CIU4_9BACT|nr:cryptochrome/photolyase family protein [Neolewinella marina]NJB84945.1 deoxyribodipyrimidine photolyase-related protein [Neolewinella marina]PHK99902.1 cryptochrome/photolyase family protein [Neolewinella marina]